MGFNNTGRGGFERQEHEITCADCGQKAKVPFKPRSDRPAYCRACYEANHKNKTN